MYKFRTMVVDAASAGPAITVGGDPRVTGTGRLLRRTKLDELPQLINVLTGDMSLVGPRPEVAKYVEAFRGEYSRVLSVRPGVTDYASIVYRDEESVLAASGDPERLYVEDVLPRKLKLNIEYIGRASFIEDIKIILKTLNAL
jgi:lipopolysaccharide/colanic/teichoic acid biosynthesis glycosyltransferase